MDLNEMCEPDLALPRQTGLEGDHSEAPNVLFEEYANDRAEQEHFYREAPDDRTHRHARVVTALRFAFMVPEDQDVWNGIPAVLCTRLARRERAALLWAVLVAAEPEDLFEALDLYLPIVLAGAPLPALDDLENSARWWAGLASLPELRAYLAACFVRLPARERAAFLAEATRRAAA